MAVELCSEISLSSPQDSRKAFDLERSESNSSPSDIDFCFRNSFVVPELPSADELFFNGKIRRVGPKQPSRPIDLDRPSVSRETTNDDKSAEKKITRLKEFLLMSDVDDEVDHETDKYLSFWQFKRSSSLNCDSTQSKSLIKSSLRFLARSNSTGSAPDPKTRKEPEKRSFRKQPSVSRKCSVPSGSGGYEFHGPTRKPPLKNWKGSGVRVSPVLSLPQLFLTNGTVDFLGFSSLFCNVIASLGAEPNRRGNPTAGE